MTGQVLITRPLAAARVWRTSLALRGVGSMIEPLLRYEPRQNSLPDKPYQAVLFTSAAGVDYLSYAALPAGWPDWPCYCVGATTTQAAWRRGWRQAGSRGDNAVELAAWVTQITVPERGVLLWPCGAERKTEPLASLQEQGFIVEPWVVYQALAAEQLRHAVISALSQGRIAVVLFTSERGARIFTQLAQQAELQAACAGMTALCLSADVAAAAHGLPWRAIVTARLPQENAMLSGLQNLLGRWTMTACAADPLYREA